MPLFNKQAHELETHFDKWIYFLKNLASFDEIPTILNEPIFQKGFDIAELSHLEVSQYEAYNRSLLDYWDVKSVEEAAFESGIEKGIEQEKLTIARAMKAQGIGSDIILAITGLRENF